MGATLQNGNEYVARRVMENQSHSSGTGSSVQQLKRRLTLDLEPAPGPASASASKRPRPAHLLTSPDLRMLKLGSPELERLIAQQGAGLMATPTPGGPQAVSAVFGRVATEEQEDYAKGFVDALHSLKQREGGGHGGAGGSGGADLTYHTLETSTVPGRAHAAAAAAAAAAAVSAAAAASASASARVKEEPDPLSSASETDDSKGMSPPLPPPPLLGQPPSTSPVNMVQQETFKLERKRLRNRIAATKCRQRKLDRISKLEDRVAIIRRDNAELMQVVNRLRDQVDSLKREVHEHAQHGCQIMCPQSQAPQC